MTVAIQEDTVAKVAKKYIGKELQREYSVFSFANDCVKGLSDTDLPKIYALYAGDGKIAAVEHVGDVPEDIDVNQMTRTAIKNDASEIFLCAKFQHSGSSTGNAKHPTHSAALEAQQINSYIDLSRTLDARDIVLRDIVLSNRENNYMLYSSNVSYIYFPNIKSPRSWELEEKSAFKPGSVNGLKDTLNFVYNNGNTFNMPEENVFVAFLNEKNKAIELCDVSIDNHMLIAPHMRKRKCMFEPVMKKAFEQNISSIVLIKNKESSLEDLVADKTDLGVLDDARKTAKEFGLKLKDYILTTPRGNSPHESLSFVKTYGME